MSITLKGREVSSRLQIQPDALDYKPESKMAGKKYHRAIFENIVFTVSPEVYGEWKNGQIAEFTIVESNRTVENPETGESQEVKSLAYGGSATWTQIKNIVANESELMVIEKKALASVNFKEKTMKELEELA